MFNKIIVLLIPIITFFYSCSSITSVERYHKNFENKENNDLRYSTDDSQLTNSDDEISEELDPSDIPDNTTNYELSELLKNIKSENLNSANEEISEKEAFLMEIIKYYKTPYKFGGNSINGIDCSGFTQSIYKNVLEINLNRSAREQFQQGKIIAEKEELIFGDLVFFDTRKRVKPGHVGIYLWDNLFVHANAKNGVIVSSLNDDYYSKRYMGARRILSNGF
jgi:cell wall-associated NlpC family hydrolase